jgi:multidrug efflux system membrane fusion protein
MEQQTASLPRKIIGRTIGVVVVLGAAIVVPFAVSDTNRYPRTDDATVRANFIQIAPEVSGRLVQLPVKDNQLVKKGDPIFLIDPRPYEYALKQALSDREALEQQIIDEQRRISAQRSAVEAAQAGLSNSKTGIQTAGSSVDVAKATVSRAKATVAAAEARLKYAINDLHRIEPLLKKQYVTVDQVDQANTAVTVAQGNLDEAQAALTQSQAQLAQAALREQEAGIQATESQARLGQAIHTVDTLDTLMSQRPARDAKVDSARLDLERCRVVAPFDAYVTNLNISEGEYAHPGGAIFTLIDARTWYVVANYRESKLNHISLGDHVDVYLMGHPDRKFSGRVESIGYGVFPEDGNVAAGLPKIEHTLNWVHLSSRFPVRVRVENPDPTLFRIGASAVTVVR